jgi:NAD(P)-dependent dehydrogenase (short-subunit alcohol dehydrogenase family)
LYIVTGASRGLGLSLVQALSADPEARTLAVSRSGLPKPLANVEDLRCDLSVAEGWRVTGEAITRRLGEAAWQRAVLINNAGMVEPVGPVERYDLETIERAVGLNLTAPIALMQAFVAGSGSIAARSIINVSSGAGRRPVFGWSCYCATKAGLDMASEVVAIEAREKGEPLRITSLAPGMMDTAMQGVLRASSVEDFPEVHQFHARHQQGALVSPDDIAAKLLRLEASGALPDGLTSIGDL